ncbi:MAG: HU family DNA-binding protein [Prevotellaceae bacterium]|jgi:nucleoid DNA-binding protein|nr:HU family DNA-binding protein [Prevotellaceae bacterium]
MDNEELVVKLSKKLRITQKKSHEFLTAFVEEIGNEIVVEKKVDFLDFGEFRMRLKEQQISENTRTNKKYLLPPKMFVNFALHSEFKKYLKTLKL